MAWPVAVNGEYSTLALQSLARTTFVFFVLKPASIGVCLEPVKGFVQALTDY